MIRVLTALFFTFALPATSLAAGAQCSRVFHTPGYFRQVVESRGLRLFVKESRQTEHTKWQGVLRHVPRETLAQTPRPINALRFAAKTLPLKLFGIETHANGGRYELTPVRAMYEHTIVRGANHLSRVTLNKELEPAFFARLPFIILISALIWSQIDAYYAEQLETHRAEIILENKALYERLIQTDYRYRSLKRQLADQTISLEEALESAYWIEFAYSQYFNFRDANPEALTSLEGSSPLLTHLAFNHLEKIFQEGVRSQPGFDVPPGRLGPINEQQKLELVQLNHALNLRYQLLTEYVHQTEVFGELRQDPKVLEALDLSLATPFGKRLVEAHEAGRIDRGQLLSMLQEEAYWQTRFAEWGVIGVRKLKRNADGAMTGQALTLDHIRSEILADIR